MTIGWSPEETKFGLAGRGLHGRSRTGTGLSRGVMNGGPGEFCGACCPISENRRKVGRCTGGVWTLRLQRAA